MAGSFFDAYDDALMKVETEALQAGPAKRSQLTPLGHVNAAASVEIRPTDSSMDRLLADNYPERPVFLAGVTSAEESYRRNSSQPLPIDKKPQQRPEKQRHSRELIIKSLLPGAPRTATKTPQRKQQPVWNTQSKIPRYPHLRDTTQAKRQPPPSEVHLKIEPNADLIWNAGFQTAFPLLKIDEFAGIPEQFTGQAGRDRDLVMGLDFGTSSVKLVLGDRGAGKAYAVPFVEATGVNAYLLPSRVFETNGIFSLSQGATVHRDLKLRFLAKSFDGNLQEVLVGFLGLVIRRCRAWLFREHTDTFANRNLLWKLVLGRAVDRAMNDEVGKVMGRILVAAWAVAGEAGVISRNACAEALLSIRGKSQFNSETLEVSVVPELAAQIYGFVMSRQFDAKAKNFYLFVDVGAGTVDVSLFQVKSTDMGTWDFSLFTSVVEPNGVINLHRARLEWWRQEFEKRVGDTGGSLIKKLQDIHNPTEQTLPIPEHYDGYFRGVKAEFFGDAVSPDDHFYLDRLVSQVRGQGIHRPVYSRIVGRVDVANLPFFLCGGGSRLPLYKNLSNALHRAPEFQWLQAHRRELGVPNDLVAPGLPQADYDRLSVAYGLSFVDVGNFAVAKAMPKMNQKSQVNWRSRYQDKDQC